MDGAEAISFNAHHHDVTSGSGSNRHATPPATDVGATAGVVNPDADPNRGSSTTTSPVKRQLQSSTTWRLRRQKAGTAEGGSAAVDDQADVPRARSAPLLVLRQMTLRSSRSSARLLRRYRIQNRQHAYVVLTIL